MANSKGKQVKDMKGTKVAKVAKAAKPAKSKKPVLTEELVPDPVTVTNIVVEESSGLEKEFSTFLADLQNMSVELSRIRTSFRVLERSVNKELKAAQKLKKKKMSSNRKPSGFVKPTLITKELADFLNLPHKSEVARTEVTREINKYIRANKLQDADNGRIIKADAALVKLLKVQKTDELTYFNLQKFMSPHFLKAGQDVSDKF